MTRTVSDGWASFHARIEEKTSRFGGRQLYRYVIVRHFATDSVWKRGFWIGDREKVIARANAVLDALECRDPLRGEPL